VSRLDFSASHNAIAKAIAARREPYVDLTASNPTAVGLPLPDVQLPRAPVYAPDPRGLPQAREASARIMASRRTG